MAKKVFTEESLGTFVDEIKSYTDNAVSKKADSSHNHAASNITSGTLSSDRLPTVPITKGGTGATTAAGVLTNLGITATATELNKLDGVTATTAELNYVDGVTSNIQTQLDAKSATGHTHNYAGSSSAGGAATSANKVNSSLTVKLNSGTTEGTNMFTFNGSAEKSVNITPSAIGAAASSHTHDDRYYTESEIDTKLSGKANTSHGNHVPTTQTANNATFLRNDNTWQKVTPANIGAAASSHTHTVANISDLTATATELNYMDGVTSNVQTQLDEKASSSHALSKGTDSTTSKSLSFGGTFTAVTDTAVSGHQITDTTTTYTMPSDRLFTTLVPTGTSIPANADLNTTTYLKVGRYFCSKNADAATLKNCPTSVAFMMEVYSPISTSIDNETNKTWVYRLRKITVHNSGVQYVQYCNAGATAGSWTYNDWYVMPRSPFAIDTNDTNGGSATLGSSTKPIYVASDGTLTACSYTLGKSVPSDAKFTDTTYSVATTSADGLMSATDKAKVDKLDAITTAGDGSAYTATVPSITSLTDGVSFVMIPHVVSTTTAPTLNVNNLGAKTIKRRLSNMATSLQAGYANSWIAKGVPQLVTYTGSYWVLENHPKPASADLYGTLTVAKGGTGNTSVDTVPTSGSTKMVTSDGIYNALNELSEQIDNNAGLIINGGGANGGEIFNNYTDNVATGKYSHAEGYQTSAVGNAAHSEGYTTSSSGAYSHSEGRSTTSSGQMSHAEGYNPSAMGTASHAEGYGNSVVPSTITASSTYENVISAWNTSKFLLAKGDASHAEGASTLALGSYSHAEGEFTEASGQSSHAEGGNSKSSGMYSHAEGYYTVASAGHAHAEGNKSTASGGDAHAEGYNTLASAGHAHAEGCNTTASGDCSHAEMYYTTALNYQHATGHYNNTSTATAGVGSGTSTGTAFVIGNGTETSASNAFRVNYNGTPYATSALTTTGCDYAEFFEWIDGNPNNEDRRGYFVTLDGEKIKKAEKGDYILGITSALPSIIGNGDECWKGRYVLDEFGAFITEEFEYELEVYDEELGEITTITKVGTKWKENPDYNPDEEYIQRENRPEWSTVGMLGVIAVRDDGTCSVNGFCKLSEGGIATSANDGYRVIARITDNIIKVIYR